MMKFTGCAAAVAAAAGLAAAQSVTLVDTTAGTATVDGVIDAGEYVASAAGSGLGFGGPVGGATLLLDSSSTTLNLAIQGLGEITGNSLRFYIGTGNPGFSTIAPSTGFQDDGGFNAESLIAEASGGGVTLPFEASHGLLISTSFGGGTDPGLNGGDGPFVGLFDLTGTGATGTSSIDGALTLNPDPIGEFGDQASDIELSIDLATLGLSAGDAVSLIAIYANNSLPPGVFTSNETFGIDLGFDNLGGEGSDTPLVFSDFISFTTVPTPGAAAVLGLGGLVATRRRR